VGIGRDMKLVNECREERIVFSVRRRMLVVLRAIWRRELRKTIKKARSPGTGEEVLPGKLG
jgi:hypothetical protein